MWRGFLVGKEVEKGKLEDEKPLQAQEQPPTIKDVELCEAAGKEPADAAPKQQLDEKQKPEKVFEPTSPAAAFSEEPALARTVEEAPKETETAQIPKKVAFETADEQVSELGQSEVPETEGAAIPADKVAEKEASGKELITNSVAFRC